MLGVPPQTNLPNDGSLRTIVVRPFVRNVTFEMCAIELDAQYSFLRKKKERKKLQAEPSHDFHQVHYITFFLKNILLPTVP